MAVETSWTECGGHPTNDDMELYIMHRAAKKIIDQIEEHLMLCEGCRCELDNVDMELRLMKVMLREYSSNCVH